MPYLAINPAAASPVLPITAVPSGYPQLFNTYEEVIFRLGNRLDLGQAQIVRWINEAYREVAWLLDLESYRGSGVFVTVPGQHLYQHGSHIRVVSKLTVDYPASQGYEAPCMNKITLEDIRLIPAYDQPLEPRVWAPYGSRLIVVYPVPTIAHNIVADFRTRPRELANLFDSIILEPEHMEGLILCTRAKAFSALQEYGPAAQAQNEWISWLRTRPSDAAQQDEGRVSRMYPARSQRQKNRSNRRM